jgi:mRNA interferase MazF
MPANFPRRGEIYIADLNPVVGSEQGGQRPVLIIQNDDGNEFSPITIVAAITSAPAKRAYPIDVVIAESDGGLRARSRVLLNQIKSIDKRRLGRYIGSLTPDQMTQVDDALMLSLGLRS